RIRTVAWSVSRLLGWFVGCERAVQEQEDADDQDDDADRQHDDCDHHPESQDDHDESDDHGGHVAQQAADAISGLFSRVPDEAHMSQDSKGRARAREATHGMYLATMLLLGPHTILHRQGRPTRHKSADAHSKIKPRSVFPEAATS